MTTARLAKRNKIPFYVAAPCSSFGPALEAGDQILIKDRDPKEVATLAGQQLGPEGCHAFTAAFDVTPAAYISGIITEKGLIRPPFRRGLKH